MIASVAGRVAAVSPEGAIVEVGGVGMLVQCAPGTIARLRVGEHATLHTALVVREDSLTLYGFGSADERATFELLQTASGVGPRLAQAILAVHSPDAVRRAVATDDFGALTLVPGIGKKGAQRIVIELKDRLGDPEPFAASTLTASEAPSAVRSQVRDALVSLGYAAREADEAARGLPPEADEQDVGLALKAALRSLGRR
ncbi:MAG TPA: Holliday junction branch migration protein RuvA [Frankiaceae bacterium]|nr:Holliday junction branch migration protein RuvA [Frankiaceae bacterium]